MQTGLAALVEPFPWAKYSRKLGEKILKPRNAGVFTKEDAESRGMHFASGGCGSISEGNMVVFYWLVDPEDGVIVDARFQVYGQSALIGAAEICCELLVSKNYDQAKRIGADMLDQQVRDKKDMDAFPMETSPHLNLVLEAVDAASAQCEHIPLASSYVAPPVPTAMQDMEGGGYPGWEELGVQQKLSLIEEVIASDVRPYIELDAGGIEVLNLLNDREVIIAYQGACVGCFSATGATLSYIQQTLRARLSADLVVVPEM